MLKYIFAVLIIGAAWAVTIVFKLPLWIAIATTGAVLFLLVLLILLRRFAAGRAARAIEGQLGGQNAALLKNARPEQRPEIEAMQQEFMRAVGALKSSRLGRRGKDALGLLPWYMIIGPPGAGKSTALRASGLQFPYLSARGGGVRGVGGTRNCDWWMTNDAIILDTAGRYATEEDDQEEWFSFLDILRRNRPHKPINGIIVAVSIAEVGGATEDQILDLSKRLRERVDEVMNHLETIVPVYVLFTKCDLVPGFLEMFADLKKSDRGQIWGFSLPLEAETPEVVDSFFERFDTLAKVAELRALQRMGEERRLEVRERLFQFPQELEALRLPLGDLIAQSFVSNVYQDTPILRGVYFTSGTQEGRPIDRVMQKMAEAFGVRPRVLDEAAPSESRSYFLTDVFRRVIFPDKDVAVAASRRSRRELLIRSGGVAGALAAALLLSLVPMGAYYKNHDFGRAVRAVSDAIAAAQPGTVDGPLADEVFEPVAADLAQVYDVATDGPPLGMRFGLYQGLREIDALTDQVRDMLVKPLLDHFERSTDRSYDALKLYLLLTQNKRDGEPSLENDEWENLRPWIAQQIRDQWKHRSRSGFEASTGAMLEKLINVYTLETLDAPEQLLLKRNEDAVRLARAALRTSRPKTSKLESLLAEIDCGSFSIALSSVVGTAGSWFTGDPVLPGSYTRHCWEEQVRPHLSASAPKNREIWVVGNDPTNDADSASDRELSELRSAYFKAMIEEWKKFLRAIHVEPQPDVEKGIAMLVALTDKPRPLSSLMKTLFDNVQLKEASLAEASRWRKIAESVGLGGALPRVPAGAIQLLNRPSADLYGPDDVLTTFAPLLKMGGYDPASALQVLAGGTPPPPSEGAKALLDSYHSELERLLQGAEIYRQDKNYDTLKALVQTSRTTVEGWVARHKTDGWDLVLGPWLLPPIQSLDIALETDHGGGANNAWCEAVVGAWDELRRKYPIDDKGKDADLAAVMSFFQPQRGAIWSHYESFLKKDVGRVGTHYKIGATGAAQSYGSELTNFLDDTQSITDFFFPNGAPQPSVNLEVRIKPTAGISRIILEVGGQQVVYRNEPERWVSLKWPGEKKGAFIRAFGRTNEETIPEEGEWGFFHLLDDGKVAVEDDHLSVAWKLRGSEGELRMDVRPPDIWKPFRNFAVPRSVAHGPSPCAQGPGAAGNKLKHHGH